MIPGGIFYYHHIPLLYTQLFFDTIVNKILYRVRRRHLVDTDTFTDTIAFKGLIGNIDNRLVKPCIFGKLPFRPFNDACHIVGHIADQNSFPFNIAGAE